jgi:Leucine-rich repeat (LRR) protein
MSLLEARRRIDHAKHGSSALRLNGLGLEELPAELFGLKHVIMLNLSGNRLSALPPELGTMTQLEGLNLTNNELTVLPKELAGLVALEELHVDEDKVTWVPEQLAHLVTLQPSAPRDYLEPHLGPRSEFDAHFGDLELEQVEALTTEQTSAWSSVHVFSCLEDGPFEALARLPFPALRKLRLGGDLDQPASMREEEVVVWLAKLQELEELWLNVVGFPGSDLFSLELPSLRQLDFHAGDDYAFEALVANGSLQGLEVLRCLPRAWEDEGDDQEPGYLALRHFELAAKLPKLRTLGLHSCTAGDEGIRALIASGLLARLEVLDLSYGAVSDEGAALLAESGALGGLKHLGLSGNWLTSTGIAALKATGVPLRAELQLEPGDDEFLYCGEVL